jgi:hypothetical protein
MTKGSKLYRIGDVWLGYGEEFGDRHPYHEKIGFKKALKTMMPYQKLRPHNISLVRTQKAVRLISSV